MPRPISATLNLSALHHNLSLVRQRAKTAKIWSVVKANAYGHGLARIWSGLAATDGFALLDLNEAILLREQGWHGPILLLEGFFQPQDLVLLDHYRLTTSVHSDWQLEAIKAARLTAPLNIYLKFNSGMNRLGFPVGQAQAVWQWAKSLSNVGEVALMSHFANADNSIGVDEQFAQIQQATGHIPAARCFANSAAILRNPQTHYDWVRPGIILYGASPSGDMADIAGMGLRPVMSLRSEIIAVQSLSAGQRVGYGGRYRASGAQRIGVVACGYADGYPRLAPSGTPIMVDGILTHTVGAISMDMLTVDLTPCPQAQIGSKVEIWGENVLIDQVAKAAGTVGYELMCALASRVTCLT
ncbi:catabolic alanine racemase DadX [Yersinia kristensenii]|uniref:catabolic alanine racemase DadX n=1 Tax=Yersinia kristensenii TaxID=28152 RepID=UPI00119E7245|nr:catabolic alanine racemase DadX [Yersinia kristensenii]MBW5812826.1 catabolic alanine racemase DadX [Yersinia kristensenii]MBW5830127.1 catabolic alanine racemase DadX [Yersinia kristensenii]MDA5491336.1 catabolic alanine racemase DadX [Yersinia kristensenii]